MSSSLFDSPSAQPDPGRETAPAGGDSYESGNVAQSVAEKDNSFDYHPVPILAPVALVLGICSLFAFLNLIAGLLIALFGLAVSAVCLLKILRSGGVLGGKSFAWAGLALSALSLLGGPPTWVYFYMNEVPDGYERVNFTEDISNKGFILENGQARPHPDVAALDGEKIFLKGYMYPPARRQNNLTAFVFCRDNGQCCFGGKPKLTDMIVVEMTEGETADFYRGLIAVAGTFHLRREYDARFGSQTGTEPVFKITATLVEPAHTSL